MADEDDYNEMEGDDYGDDAVDEIEMDGNEEGEDGERIDILPSTDKGTASAEKVHNLWCAINLFQLVHTIGCNSLNEHIKRYYESLRPQVCAHRVWGIKRVIY